jgi:hypothetical protein
MEKSIEDWCKELNLYNYKVNDDGSVDSGDHINISFKFLEIIPIKFGIIYGDFNCSNNQLLSLNSSPNKVFGELFTCCNNRLKSLIGGPTEVENHYNCSYNELTSLKGSPKIITGVFHCHGNPIFEEYYKYNSYANYIRSIKIKNILLTNNEL